MADHSKIEWTDATWNPVRGCAIVSPGCTNCYAMRQARRQSGEGKAYEGLTQMSKGGPVWTGAIRTAPELLDWPLHRRKPLRIFVNSMSDLFHEDVPDHFIAQVFEVMAEADHHIFQILTKRADRMLKWCGGRNSGNWPGFILPWPLPNVWLGVSVEDQRRADERIPLLLQTPAAVRWISAEPLLGRVDLSEHLGMWWNSTMSCWEATATKINRRSPFADQPGIGWVVAGGESGPGAREMRKEWARSMRDQCAAAGVPFFFKQWGAWAPDPTTRHPHRNVGKKRAGRELDGRTHDEYPA